MDKRTDPDALWVFPPMTLREHYAGLIMAGLMPSREVYTTESLAKEAVEYADELIKELHKK